MQSQRHYFVFTLVALALFTACTHVERPRREDPLAPDARFEETELQAAVMDMADEHIAGMGEAIQLVVRNPGVDARARWMALSFLRNGTGATLDIGAGTNPAIGLLDLLVLVTLQTWSFEENWIPNGVGEAAGVPALARLRRSEAQTWKSAARFLTEEQRDSLRRLIERWKEHNADRTVVGLVRFDEFMDERRLPSHAHRESAAFLLQDILAATAAVEDAKLLGERALWFVNRLPYVLGQQIELTSYRLVDQPEFEELRAGSSQLMGMAKSLQEILADWPEKLSEQRAAAFASFHEERKAAIEQILTGLSRERETLFSKFEESSKTLGPMLVQLQELVKSSTLLVTELQRSATVADRLVARFDPLERNGREGLDLEQLERTAERAGAGAVELRLLLERLDATLDSKSLVRGAEQLERSGTDLLDALFLRGLGLIAALLLGLAGLRLLPRRRA